MSRYYVQPQFRELADYLTSRKLSLRSFEKISGLNKSTLSRLLRGRLNRVDPNMVTKISRATDGVIGWPQFVAFLKRLEENGTKHEQKSNR